MGGPGSSVVNPPSGFAILIYHTAIKLAKPLGGFTTDEPGSPIKFSIVNVENPPSSVFQSHSMRVSFQEDSPPECRVSICQGSTETADEEEERKVPAFDTVPQALLWKKLLDIGLNFRFINLIKNYYENMTAAVRWNN
ncbi:hypothetical protein LAZ67_14000453 [Cordylochernes scorpioides]|uniref:Uncharacterized protein n=1 Tax=Cordylochernes scorpioides TaxID=51811 RepID=A0ABY6L5M9_9ARAC|nr:hypothetical protein LAZ67_14000453 [Cordylochernes scorpioides]